MTSTRPASVPAPRAAPETESRPAAGVPAIVPRPVSLRTVASEPFPLTAASRVIVRPGSDEASAVAEQLAALLRPATGFPAPVAPGSAPDPDGAIVLDPHGPASLGAEGYTLSVNSARAILTAHGAAGLFRAAQTLRQLLPATVEASSVQPGPWRIPAVEISDAPRFRYRGVMLDVSRHFFGVADVKRYLDLAAMYKINRLHLHLSDDQGWRIAIDAWPRLATHGGSTGVGGSAGGHYTKAEYAEIVAYAAARHITVVPEIDMPGHTNAALASYPELNADGLAPPLYTGVDVGFSSLAIDKEITYSFLDDVIGELAAITPGGRLHIGGDEAHATSAADYVAFLRRALPLVAGHGKRVMAWQEAAAAESLPAGTVIQYWGAGDDRPAELTRRAVAQGARVVMSPANRAYLDMKYDSGTPYGLSWAGHTSVKKSYGWDPAEEIPGVGEADIAGVEAPLWTETVNDIRVAELMAYPRLPGIAEIGWSPAAGRSWSEYRDRLAAHGPRWGVLGVNYHRAPDVPWP